ncbi:MAG: Holliday junction resolvase RuvX [Clostridiales bacterium]|nr:Holliday junction resolvase RuvX [Clostridiales bacterium]
MVILSVDYGDTRTGIAICDKMEMLASPVTVIKQTYMPKLIDSICGIINERSPELVVVGLPVNINATEGDRAAKCRELAAELEAKSGIKTVMWDERLTTVMAHNYLNETNVRGEKRKKVIDAVAATIILQDYLDHRKNS